MNFKTRVFAVLLIISVFLISSCEVYQTLYGNPRGQEAPTGNIVKNETAEEPSNETTAEETPQETEGTQEEEEAQEPEEQIPEEEAPETQVIKQEGKPIVVIIQETELVSLVPKAEDPDKDTTLAFTFTSPLNENGEWQTSYGDAGEYTVTVTASDGQLATTRDILVIVNKKEESPAIDESRPIENALSIDETDALQFSVVASDLNKDPLQYSWKLDGNGAGDGTGYLYETTYDDSGSHTVKIDVSDGTSTASKLWSIDVRNVNRKPVLEGLQDLTVRETDKVVITALASDDDKDAIEYSINDKRFEQQDNVFTWETGYDSAGTYEITVSASDGQDTAEQTFNLVVENVNRPPVIVDIVPKK